RAGPLERRVDQRARVLDAVLGRREERVRRDVVDEDELVLGRRREVARAALGGGRRVVAAAAAVVVVVAGRLSAGRERGRQRGAPAGERAVAQERPALHARCLIRQGLLLPSRHAGTAEVAHPRAGARWFSPPRPLQPGGRGVSSTPALEWRA